MTVSLKNNTVTQLIVGVLLGLSSLKLVFIFTRICHWIQFSWRLMIQRASRPANHDVGTDERSALLENEHGRSRDVENVASRNIQGGTRTDRVPIEGSSIPRDASSKSKLLAVVLTIGLSAYVVANTFEVTLPTISLGLLKSDQCGWWALNPNANDLAQAEDDQIQAQRERRATQYGRNCYRQSSISNPGQCNVFSSQAIPHETITEQRCPFKDKSLCPGTGYTAVRFTTEGFNSKRLGINTPNVVTINRTTICQPLNIDQGFIHKHNDSDGNVWWQYYLGGKRSGDYSSDYTFEQHGDPFYWDIPAYSLSVYQATPFPDIDYWTPIPGLEVEFPGPYYLTMIFISSCHIFYDGPSKDPIFGATQTPYDQDLYWNPDPRARPLACIDWIEVCHSDGTCVPTAEEVSGEHNFEAEFLREALEKSTTFNSIEFQLGSALVAQESIEDYVSSQLDDNQYIIESEALFNTSLATIQFSSLDIAQGMGHEKDSYKLRTPEWAQEQMCNKFKIRLREGYTNVNIVATIGILCTPLTIWILSLQLPWYRFREEMQDQFDGHWIVLDLALWYCITRMLWIIRSAATLRWHRQSWKYGPNFDEERWQRTVRRWDPVLSFFKAIGRKTKDLSRSLWEKLSLRRTEQSDQQLPSSHRQNGEVIS